MSERMTEKEERSIREFVEVGHLLGPDQASALLCSHDFERERADENADDARALEARVKALEEVLGTIRGLCRGCLKPMEEHPPGPPCPPFLPGPMRAPGSALFRLVDAALEEPTP